MFFLGGGGGGVVLKTGAILGYLKASSSAPFQEERLGQGFYRGDVM